MMITRELLTSLYMQACRETVQGETILNKFYDLLLAELSTDKAAELPVQGEAFQQRVLPWMLECFGEVITKDITERCHRFFEESTEKVQAHGMTRSEAHQLVDYTYDRPIGEPKQETGGVLVTLAALDIAAGIDMHECGETELTRILNPDVMNKIRAKQAAKPHHSPLPATPALKPSVNELVEAANSIEDCFKQEDGSMKLMALVPLGRIVKLMKALASHQSAKEQV